MLENILTHPTSTLTGIDVFPDNLKETYLENLRISGFPEKAVTLTGLSQIELGIFGTGTSSGNEFHITAFVFPQRPPSEFYRAKALAYVFTRHLFGFGRG